MSNKKTEIFDGVLIGNELENALNFVNFLNANEIIQTGQHEWYYKGKCACYIDTRHESHSWIVWTDGDYSCEQKDFPIDEGTKEIAWANVMKCGNCEDVDCSGKVKTVFGKEFANICNANNVNMTFMFTNPDAETLECVKKLVLMRQYIIDNENITNM